MKREGGTESDRERESATSRESKEINNLSLHGLYGELQLPVVKMDLDF